MHPGFAKQDHARVVGAHHLVEAGHEVLVGVGVRVYAQRVNAGLLNPPQGVLNQVVGSVFVLQIPVRHGVVEPAAFKKVLVPLGGVRVKQRGFAVVGARVLLFGVEPRGIRLRLVEVVPVSGVVVHHVHHVLHAALVQGVRQAQEVCVGPKARIHQVVVRDGVPVVGGAHLVVGQPGVDPNGRNAQGLNVIQMLFNAHQIAAVAVVRLLAVQAHFQLSVHAVVLGVAVGKPVRRDQVHLVRRVQPHELAFGGVARLQGVSEIQGSRRGRHGKGQVHRFRVGVQPEHNLQITSVLQNRAGQHPHVCVFELGYHRTLSLKGRGFHQKPKGVVGHAHPPMRWIHPFWGDRTLFGPSEPGREDENSDGTQRAVQCNFQVHRRRSIHGTKVGIGAKKRGRTRPPFFPNPEKNITW